MFFFTIFRSSCHAMGTSAFARILPNYFFTYVPIIIVMIVNPVFYWRTSIKVGAQFTVTYKRKMPVIYNIIYCIVQSFQAEEMVVSVSGRYTHNERKHLRSLRLKFFCINLVYYICWLPNIVNAILLWTLWDDLPRTIVLVDWYLMVSKLFTLILLPYVTVCTFTFTPCRLCSILCKLSWMR